MQDLLSQLSTPIVIGLIIAVIVALAIVVLLARRRRNRQEPPGDAAVSLGGPIDYTSLPLDEEPSGWRDRFARLSLAGKILAVLVPILAVLGLLALVLTLLPTGSPTAILPTPVPLTIAVTDAAVIRADPLTIGVDVQTTGLSANDTVTVEVLEDGQPFAYLNPEQAQGAVRRNRVEIQAQRAEGAPTPTEGRSYTVVARAPDGTASEAVSLVVPEVNRIGDAFYNRGAAAAPTAEPTTTPQPTEAAAPTEAPTEAPTVEPTAVAELPTGPEAPVGNGGNVRSLPLITAENVIGGVNAGENVQLLARTPNGEWYRIRTVRDEIGWVSASLISVPGDAQVPVASVVTVFVNGPVYEAPDQSSTELDRVNQNEVVELTQRTAAGDWYQVTNPRGISGWVPANLLGIPDEVAQAVPVAP
jgi:SH3-like domain-containing protein